VLTAELFFAALLGAGIALAVARIFARVRDARSPLQQLIESVRDFGIMVLDETGRVTSCNHGAALIQGFTHAELVGRSIDAFYLPEDVQQGRPGAMLALAAEHGQVEEEGWRRRKDGSRYWANVIVAALREPGGRLIGYGKVVRDATARKAADNKLNRTLSILAATLDATSGGILVVDNADKVVNVNLHFVQMWKITLETAMSFHEDIVLANVLEQVKDPTAFRRTMLDVAAQRTGESTDVIEFNDGRVFERHSRPHKIGDDIVGRVWTYRDITERKQAEDDLKHELEQAIEASKAKSRFVAAASHDLRQPLQALALLSAALEPHVTPAGRPLFHKVNQSVESLTGLFDALLDVSRLDAGAVPMLREPVPLASLFDEMRAHFESLASAKGLRLRVVPPKGIVMSDFAQLQRIIGNLLMNAITYSLGGTVMLCARRCANDVRIEVRDTGIGIAPSEHEAIFQEFYQIANPERDRRKGLGLGLAIAQRIAMQLGHRIVLRSAPGRGSVFGVIVERAPEMLAAIPAAPLIDDKLRGLNVLVIDDEADIRSAVGALLQRWGCDAWLADTPEAAQKLVDQNGRPPDAIICDYRLREGEDGITTIGELRKRWGMVPAAILSGDVSDPIRDRARGAALPFLRKPVRPATLRTLLNTLARGE
jgi:two-component system, sensor histidine kinase